MAEVSERRIRPIEEAVRSKNWKQALQLCEKWHKKGEKSDRFLAIRAYVLAKQQDAASVKRGQDEIIQLCNRTPAITDLDTIYQIQAALNDLAVLDDGERKLWERAAAAKPDDKDIAMIWLDEAIDRCDWQSAQKATMALRKSSPKERNYEFWTIFMCYLIYQDQSVSEKERTMFGTLAYRMLSKAAEAVPKREEELLSAGKAIQSPEELSLLVRVYLDTGHVHDAKELLTDSKTLGPESAIFKLDHDLHRSLQLDVLEAAQDWSSIVNELQLATTASSTENIQIGRILRVLFATKERTKDINFIKQMRDCLSRSLKAFPSSRDLRHGMLRVHQIDHAEGRCTADDLMKAFQEYFSMRCSQLACFDEFRDAVGVLDTALQRRFVELAREEGSRFSEALASSITPVLNALKLEYCFLISPSVSAMLARDFVCKVVRRYEEFCNTDRGSDQSVAQLAMLACMTMFHVTHTGQERINDRKFQHVSFLQTVFLLRHCLTRCRDDYPTLVVLSRILTLLGTVSFSASIIQKLSIKNLQWENAGHLLITRLSTLHPQRSNGDEGTFDPLQTLDLAVAANANSVRSVRRHIMAGLNHKSYVNVIETIELREDLKKSFSKQLYDVESARIKRLRDLPGPEREPLSSGSFVDCRDFSFIPSYEHPTCRPFAHYLETGPKIKERWLRVMKMCRAIADMMYMDYHEPQSIKQTDIQELATSISQFLDLLKTSQEELTQSESNNCTVQSHIGIALTLRLQHNFPATSSADLSDDNNKATFDASIQYIQDWLNDTANQRTEHPFEHSIHIQAERPIAPSWQYLHSAFSILESLQLIAQFLALQAKSSKGKSKSKAKAKAPPAFVVSVEQQKRMLDLVLQIEGSTHNSARTMKGNLNASGVLGGMIDAVFARGGNGEDGSALGESGDLGELSTAFGKELEKLPGAEAVAEAFCGEVKESWEDALEGVLGISVRKWK